MASSSPPAEGSFYQCFLDIDCSTRPASARRPASANLPAYACRKVDWNLELARIWKSSATSDPASIAREYFGVGVGSEESQAVVLGSRIALLDRLEQMRVDLKNLEGEGEGRAVVLGRRIILQAHIEQIQIRMERLEEYQAEWSVLEEGM